MKKEVVLIYRKQFQHTYSIEFIFDNLVASVNRSFKIKKYILPKFSNSILNRIINLIAMLRLRHKIVHVTGDVHYAILGAWFSHRILTIHDLAFMHQNKGIKRRILKWLYVILPVKFAHQITVVSEATKKDVLKYVKVDPQKIKVIPNFISDRFRPILDRTFNIDHPNILQIGTAFNKNISNLAEALSGIPCTLTIVGKLDEEQKKTLYKFKIEFINKIDLTEDAVYQEYKKANLLIFVSTIEGFGMPIIEAQACGLSVVTSNYSSMPEVAGDAAIFVDPCNVASITDGILDMINNENLRNGLIKKGLENVKRFSKDKTIAQYNSLYEELDKSRII